MNSIAGGYTQCLLIVHYIPADIPQDSHGSKAFGSAADAGRSHSGLDSLGAQRFQESDEGCELFEARDWSKLGRFTEVSVWSWGATPKSSESVDLFCTETHRFGDPPC